MRVQFNLFRLRLASRAITIILVTWITSTSYAANQRDFTAILAQGKQVFADNCAGCHQLNGSGLRPIFPPLQHSVIVAGPAKINIQRILNGKPGTPMQAFKDQLSDADIAAVITYERYTWGKKSSAKALITPQSVNTERHTELKSRRGFK